MSYLAMLGQTRVASFAVWNGNEASKGSEIPDLTHYERDIIMTRAEEKKDYVAPETSGLIDPLPVPAETLPETKKETEQTKRLQELQKVAETTPKEQAERKQLSDPFAIPIEVALIGLGVVAAIWFQAIRS